MSEKKKICCSTKHTLSRIFQNWEVIILIRRSELDCRYRESQTAITCSKLTIEILEQGLKCYCCLYVTGVFIVNVGHILHVILVFVVNSQQVNAGWDLWNRLDELDFVRGKVVLQPAFTCSNSTAETGEQCVNFEHIFLLVPMFPMLALNK